MCTNPKKCQCKVGVKTIALPSGTFGAFKQISKNCNKQTNKQKSYIMSEEAEIISADPVHYEHLLSCHLHSLDPTV